MEKSSIFPYFCDPFPLIEKTQNKEWVFVNHGTTTRENLKSKTNQTFARNDVTIRENETFTGWEVRYLHSLGK